MTFDQYERAGLLIKSVEDTAKELEHLESIQFHHPVMVRFTVEDAFIMDVPLPEIEPLVKNRIEFLKTHLAALQNKFASL